MKIVLLTALLLSIPAALYGAGECDNATDNSQCASSTTTASLPQEALAEIAKLRVDMRYFKAIGFHKKSKEKRDAIAAIYEQHGAAVPEQYRD